MFVSTEFRDRVRRVHRAMGTLGVKAFLVSSPRNVLYLTGKDTGRVLLTNEGDFLYVRDLYKELYSSLYCSQGYPFEVRVFEKGVIKEALKEFGVRKLFVEDISYSSFVSLGKDLVLRLGTTDLVERQRMVKSQAEIEVLRKSCGIALKGMRRAQQVLKPGVSEIDALSEVEYIIRKNGSDAPPFDDGMLLSSGAGSADVHAKAGRRKIKLGTTVVVDLGARNQGYHSDMTRTFKIGRVNGKKKDLLEFVDNLKNEAIDMLRPGIKAADVHSFIESEIEKKGYKFYHSSGHGVGLNIHELPNIGKDSKDTLKENMVFTIEPGIYIPNELGVRFEDTVLLKKNKAEVLTRYKI
jgi:Xaa-Pro aminopeptidase